MDKTLRTISATGIYVGILAAIATLVFLFHTVGAVTFGYGILALAGILASFAIVRSIYRALEAAKRYKDEAPARAIAEAKRVAEAKWLDEVANDDYS